MKTGFNNVVLHPMNFCCQQHVATLLSITRCNNIVDNNVHGVQHNIVEACSHQLGTTCAFLAVYLKIISFHFLDSNGCLHVHPDAMKEIDSILQDKLNVKANKNPFGKLPYPYTCQGILSIEQIDGFSRHVDF